MIVWIHVKRRYIAREGARLSASCLWVCFAITPSFDNLDGFHLCHCFLLSKALHFACMWASSAGSTHGQQGGALGGVVNKKRERPRSSIWEARWALGSEYALGSEILKINVPSTSGYFYGERFLSSGLSGQMLVHWPWSHTPHIDISTHTQIHVCASKDKLFMTSINVIPSVYGITLSSKFVISLWHFNDWLHTIPSRPLPLTTPPSYSCRRGVLPIHASELLALIPLGTGPTAFLYGVGPKEYMSAWICKHFLNTCSASF